VNKILQQFKKKCKYPVPVSIFHRSFPQPFPKLTEFWEWFYLFRISLVYHFELPGASRRRSAGGH
jgi:hypothetical protein